MSVKKAGKTDESEQRLPSKAIMPLLSLQRHWRKSFIVFCLIVSIGPVMVWGLKKGAPTYYAEAVIQVNFRYAPNLNTVQEIETYSDTQYERLVSQQTKTITRFDVIERALYPSPAENKDSQEEEASPKDKDRPIDKDSSEGKASPKDEGSPEGLWRLWQKPGESKRKAIQRLMGALRVIPVNDTYLVKIGLEDADRYIIAPLINAVVNSYIKAAKDEIFFGQETRVKNLEARRDAILGTIKDLSIQLQGIADRLGLTTFEEGLENPYDRILIDMETALETARRERVTAAAELEAIKSKHERLLKLSLVAEAKKLTASDRALGDLRAYLYQRRAKLVQTMSGLKPSHEGRQAAEREIEQINVEIKQSTAAKVDEMKKILKERRDADMRAEVAEYEAKLEEASKVEDAIKSRVDKRKKDFEGFMQAYNEGFGLREEMDRQRRQLNLVRDRIDSITIEENAPGYVRLVSDATVPEEPYSGGRKKFLILFFVAATGAALTLPLALDFVNTQIRTPIDLHRILGFAPNSWLPEIVDEHAKVLFEQQVERLAISILRDIDEYGEHCSFFVTETLPGAGKTLVTYELADHLQRLGVSTLVVSADPKNHAINTGTESANANDVTPTRLGNPDELELSYLRTATPGLVEIMGNEVGIDQAIVQRGDDADWIGFGEYDKADRIDNIVHIKDILKQLMERYDLVLVDGPALLLSAKAEALAGICYGTLIVVDSVHTQPKPLKRALAMIERASPEVVGAVLNHAPMFNRGGYFRDLAKSIAHDKASETQETNQNS